MGTQLNPVFLRQRAKPKGPIPGGDFTDAELVKQVLEGHSEKFEFLMRRYNGLLFHLARGILRDEAEAEDVVQETYVRAYMRLDQFQGPAGFSSWLGRIATNEAYGRFRRFSRAARLAESVSRQPALSVGNFSSEGPAGPEMSAAKREMRGLLERSIDSLPDPYRVVFMLRGVDQLTVAETASCLNIKQATVKTRFHRARLLLRKKLQHYVDTAASDAFPFAGARCDRIVKTVFDRLDLSSGGA